MGKNGENEKKGGRIDEAIKESRKRNKEPCICQRRHGAFVYFVYVRIMWIDLCIGDMWMRNEALKGLRSMRADE